jgi:hypothetical protein
MPPGNNGQAMPARNSAIGCLLFPSGSAPDGAAPEISRLLCASATAPLACDPGNGALRCLLAIRYRNHSLFWCPVETATAGVAGQAVTLALWRALPIDGGARRTLDCFFPQCPVAAAPQSVREGGIWSEVSARIGASQRHSQPGSHRGSSRMVNLPRRPSKRRYSQRESRSRPMTP